MPSPHTRLEKWSYRWDRVIKDISDPGNYNENKWGYPTIVVENKTKKKKDCGKIWGEIGGE